MSKYVFNFRIYQMRRPRRVIAVAMSVIFFPTVRFQFYGFNLPTPTINRSWLLSDWVEASRDFFLAVRHGKISAHLLLLIPSPWPRPSLYPSASAPSSPLP
uniref:Uncharacterized protein n=1 Tax=Setaria viridis TaxID=4556 RepID=A0A4V6D143_SETVI|nr:hypothetical protein SEVIR_9G211500v2 [Setaria viridis]